MRERQRSHRRFSVEFTRVRWLARAAPGGGYHDRSFVLTQGIVLASILVLFGRLSAVPLQQQPTFRAGIELVTVDVTVLDKRGQPVLDLSAADFAVAAGGKMREVVSIEFITSGQRPAPGAALPDLQKTPNSASVRRSAGLAAPRAFFFVVDVSEIRAGEGRLMLSEMAEYLAELPPVDDVGLLVLPVGERVELTSDRATVQSVLRRVAGFSTQLRECAPTLGEAAGIDAGDSRAGQAYAERTRVLGCPPGTGFSRLNLAMRRRGTEFLVGELGRLAQSMTHVEGRKAIVLVAEGFFMDSQIREAWREFVSTAAKSGVVVYCIHLNFPLTEAGVRGQSTLTRLLDDQYGFDGMAEAAANAGGSAFRAIASAVSTLKRLDTELSGYYLLSFRRDRQDEPGRRIKIDVKVKPPNLDVRFRQSFTPGPWLKSASVGRGR